LKSIKVCDANIITRNEVNILPLEFIRDSVDYLQIAGITDPRETSRDVTAAFPPITQQKIVRDQFVWDQKENRAESMRGSQQSCPSSESAPLPGEY
jgi:hypothetical protein